MTESINKKTENLINSETGLMPADAMLISRNGLRTSKKGNRINKGTALAALTSYGTTESLGGMREVLNGSHDKENPPELSEIAQEIRIRKAAEKRARRSMQ